MVTTANGSARRVLALVCRGMWRESLRRCWPSLVGHCSCCRRCTARWEERRIAQKHGHEHEQRPSQTDAVGRQPADAHETVHALMASLYNVLKGGRGANRRSPFPDDSAGGKKRTCCAAPCRRLLILVDASWMLLVSFS